ncbi:uncharacterized protein STEHIDRAFT_45107, partial [Stereum hirsutum FP-91666 SS1]|uniref:uncharacterized protein n=1 Tax=Stereum hirsutum (strain FP-91666) TaxID=721885 RepID=UPI000444A113
YHGRRPTWLAALTLLTKKLQIDGFRSGLTALQTANNLVFLGICEPPSADTVAQWIWEHPGLGAFKGLQSLGFQLHNRDHVRVAFRAFYDHLDQHLSLEMKAVLGFGTLFVEHVLCKHKRWATRIKE